MKKAIAILSALFLLTQGTALAAHAGRHRIDRGPTGYGNGCDCSSLEANAKLKLTTEQVAQIRALDDKYEREIEPIREQLYKKGRELKAEWLQPNPDLDRIEILQGEVAKLREQMRAPLAAQRAEVLKVLTLEQRAHLPDDGPRRVFTKPGGLGRW
jgi:Spy/CpxP family protein refolding chaperone